MCDVFFFKQKTAYEMRISDWSSDVCSADLELLAALGIGRGEPILRFDPDAAHEAILALPWVKTASVERRLPDTIFVRIEERRPMALWQNERQLKEIGRASCREGVCQSV